MSKLKQVSHKKRFWAGFLVLSMALQFFMPGGMLLNPLPVSADERDDVISSRLPLAASDMFGAEFLQSSPSGQADEQPRQNTPAATLLTYAQEPLPDVDNRCRRGFQGTLEFTVGEQDGGTLYVNLAADLRLAMVLQQYYVLETVDTTPPDGFEPRILVEDRSLGIDLETLTAGNYRLTF